MGNVPTACDRETLKDSISCFGQLARVLTVGEVHGRQFPQTRSQSPTDPAGTHGQLSPGNKNCHQLHFYHRAAGKPTRLPHTCWPPARGVCTLLRQLPHLLLIPISRLKDSHFWCMISLNASHDFLLLGSTN